MMDSAIPGVSVPVSRRALVQRLRRKLKDDGIDLKRSRSRDQVVLFGEWFLVCGPRGVIDRNVVLEVLARKIGCMHPWEVLV